MKGYQDGEGLESMVCNERLRELGFFRLNKRRVKGDLTAVFHCLMVGRREDKFFSNRIRGKIHALQYVKFF